MKSSFEYRSYYVSMEDGRYTAKSLDGEGHNLTSQYLLRVLRGIDSLWDSLENMDIATSFVPSWINQWLSESLRSVDLDVAADMANPLPLPEPCNAGYADPIRAFGFPNEAVSKSQSSALPKSIAAMVAATSMGLIQFVGEAAPLIAPALV